MVIDLLVGTPKGGSLGRSSNSEPTLPLSWADYYRARLRTLRPIGVTESLDQNAADSEMAYLQGLTEIIYSPTLLTAYP